MNNVLYVVGTLKFISCVPEVGMLCMNENPYLACSPDGISLVKCEESISESCAGTGDTGFQGVKHWVAPIEVK